MHIDTNIAGLDALFQSMEEFNYYMTILQCQIEGSKTDMLYGTHRWSKELHHIHFPIQANFFDRAKALWSDKVNFHPSILG